MFPKCPNNLIRYLLLIIFIFIDESAFPQEYSFVSFNENPVIGNTFIYSLTKDSLGYLWIGTADGLIGFNGKSFRKYTTADSLSDDFVSCSTHDGDNIWLGHTDGSLTFGNRGRFKKLPVKIDNAGPVTGFARDPEGQIWMTLLNGGLVRLDRSPAITAVKRIDGIESLLDIIFIKSDIILTATSTGLYLCKLTDSVQLQITEKIIKNEVILCVISNYKGDGYYATSKNCVYELDHKFRVVDTINHIPGIQAIATDRFNTLWIATYGKGLINYNPENNRMVSFVEPAGENIKTVFICNEGNVWAGGYGTSLTKISNQIFTSFDYPGLIYGHQVKDISHESNYTWIATEKGIFNVGTEGTVRYFNNRLGDEITEIACDQNGNTWIGTRSDGIYRLNNTYHLQKINISSGSLEQSITSLVISDRYLWAGTKKGLCRIGLDDLQVKWYTIADGLPHNSINSLFKDHEGRIWISSRSNSLAWLENNRIKRILMPLPNPAISFSEMAVDHDKSIWAGTIGNGLYKLGEDSVLNLTVQNGLYSDFCHDVIIDKPGNIWVVHKDGLSRIDTKTNFVRSYSNFGDAGEVTFMPHTASVDSEGRIWIGTENGAMLIDQSREFEGLPPVPEILSVVINNEPYPADLDRIVLKPGKYTIEIEYGAICHKEPDGVTYSIFFEGYDHQPEMTRISKVEYQNITEGRFTFNLNALNSDGVISERPDSIEIFIRKPLRKHWWFYSLIIFVAAGIIIGYIKRREYIFQQERKLLEEKVMERTREILEQKNEIEEQRDLIRMKNAEITSSIRYAQEIQNALLPPASKLERYFPEHFIFLRAKDIVSGDFYWLARKNERLIFAVADCTGHGVPGGFMSMLGITLLNEIVNVEGLTDSDKIVNRLHTLVHKSLNRSRADGLDMALCSYDWTNRVIQYTGAMNHLIYFRDGFQHMIRADQYSVNMTIEEEVTFSKKELKLKKGDMIYLFSDGFMDQFGGEKDKKFSSKRFYNLLHQIHQLPVKEQERVLDKKLADWQKDCIQTDDITIMGIRF